MSTQATLPVYIWEIIGEVVASTSAAVVSKNPTVTLLDRIKANEEAVFGSTLIQQIRYSKSSFDELIETLAQSDVGEEKFNKYPLIHLVRDFAEERGQDAGVYASTTLNIIFIHQTLNTYKIEDRETKVFKPVLYPIYYEFMRQLGKNNWIFGSDSGSGEFVHRKTDRAFWGNRKLQGSANILNDYVDAIDIQVQLKFNFTNC